MQQLDNHKHYFKLLTFQEINQNHNVLDNLNQRKTFSRDNELIHKRNYQRHIFIQNIQNKSKINGFHRYSKKN